MTTLKQTYLPVASLTMLTVELADPNRIQLKRGDKLMVRACAGRVLAIDYEKGVVQIGFLAEKANLYQATAWEPMAPGVVEDESEFVSVMQTENDR